MQRRFATALLGALVLHAALIGLSALSRDGSERELPLASQTDEVEVSMLDDGPSSTAATESSSGVASSHAAARARAASTDRGSVRSPALGLRHRETVANAVDPDAFGSIQDRGSDAGDLAPPAPAEEPSRRIDLGLDGSILARALPNSEVNGAERAPTRRPPPVVFDSWSETVVSKVAHGAALTDGSALLTIQWDADGRLASIQSSAESSGADAWRKLSAALQRQLARRPKASARGLRLVYLIKSEFVKPGERSKLPEWRNAQVQQFRDDYLPPASALMLGVNADTSLAGRRVVSVTLTSGHVL